jgi:hypothetical protein
MTDHAATRPACYLLLGSPGTGKYTVAQELVAQLRERGEEVRLLDNHRVSNILFDLIAEADGRSRLPTAIFERVRELNLSVLRTIDELSPRDWSFVFTHHLVDTEDNRVYVAELARVAHDRKARFVPVVLTCELGELAGRIPRVDRRDRNKLVDVERGLAMTGDPIVRPDAALALDVTTLPPAVAAGEIIAHGDGLPAGS